MREFLRQFNGRPGATEAAILSSEQRLGVEFPVDYVEFLKLTNGGEGFVGEEYVILWAVEELAEMQQSYQVVSFAPGLLIFGSNGGGEAFGFDTRLLSRKVVKVPFVGMSWEYAEPVGDAFLAFLANLHSTGSNQYPRLSNPDCQGKEVFEITPVILGGSPTDPSNKMILGRREHIQAVAHWNGVIKGMRANGPPDRR